MSDLTSRPYKPNPAMACEACCFGSGEHEAWCNPPNPPAWPEWFWLWKMGMPAKPPDGPTMANPYYNICWRDGAWRTDAPPE